MIGEGRTGEEAALAISAQLDLRSTEDHDHHLRDEGG